MRIVLTGCPCSGKSSVFEELEKRQIFDHFYPELAREWLDFFGKHEPWKHPSFNQQLVDKDAPNGYHFFQAFLDSLHKKTYHEADMNIINVYDRSLVDQVVYRDYYSDHAKPLPLSARDLVAECQLDYRYDKVFYFPYWDEIYKCDAVRSETKEEAQEIDKFIFADYYMCNYKEELGNFIRVPFGTIKERVNFIYQNVYKSQILTQS